MKFELQEQLGKYPLIREIGSGATSSVYLARDPFGGRCAGGREVPELHRVRPVADECGFTVAREDRVVDHLPLPQRRTEQPPLLVPQPDRAIE